MRSAVVGFGGSVGGLFQFRHPRFQRKGADLVMKREITLLEALTGTKFVVEHLDGHRVVVSSAPGQVIQPDSVMQIKDEGMPVFGNTFVFGCLFVQFDVKFPKTLELTDAMKRVRLCRVVCVCVCVCLPLDLPVLLIDC